MNLETELRKHIKAVVHPLKSADELELVLKAKLTKRELKLLKAWACDLSQEDVLNSLKLTNEDYDNLSTKLIKKINQEKVKQALYDI